MLEPAAAGAAAAGVAAAGAAGATGAFAAGAGAALGVLLMLEGLDLVPPRRLACASEGSASAVMVKAITATAVEREEVLRMAISWNQKKLNGFCSGVQHKTPNASKKEENT
jgi:DNA-binding LacI/PurR family transcriptional regulator